MVVPVQTKVAPEIAPGVAGMLLTVTFSVWGGLLPQILFATTEIVPPLVPAVALTELVPDAPDQPEGKTQE